MKLLSVTRSPIILKPLKERWYEMAEDTRCLLRTDCGCLYYYLHKGWKFDGRSGGWLVDLISANLGTQAEIWAYAIHDSNFYGLGLSFETTNLLLKQQLMLDAKYGRIRASIIKLGVDTPFARASFESNSPEEEENKKLINFQWMDDARGLLIAQAIDFSNHREKLNDLGASSVKFRKDWNK